MPRAQNTVPKYRLHKGSGQAVVTLSGRDFYLGPHGTAASRREYDRVVAEWIASGRTLGAGEHMTVTMLMVAYLKYAQEYYRHPDGRKTSEATSLKYAFAHLRRLYGATRAADFGPKSLKAVMQSMIGSGWARTSINRHVSRIRGMFKWAVSNELIPPSVHHGLSAVSGLKRGRSGAVESEPVLPVSIEVVEATLPHCPPPVRMMIQVQLLTGMRPGELLQMRAADVDRSTPVWTFRPPHHKNLHHGHTRAIAIGPKAQAILEPLFGSAGDGPLFNPQDSMEAVRARRHEQRMTPEGYGNGVGSNLKKKPKVRVKNFYTVDAYRRAIGRACDRAFCPPGCFPEPGKHYTQVERREIRQRHADWVAKSTTHRWHPHQLRHTAATEIRRLHGVEAAQVVLGHKTLAVTELYAERDFGAAARVAAEIG